MSDFVSPFWSYAIVLVTLASVIGCAVFLRVMSTKREKGASIGTTGHVWDEDLAEWNNPLPRWWMWLFYLTVAFGLAYLALYPGLGSYPGLLGWTSRGQYSQEMAQAQQKYGPIFDKYLKEDIKAVAADQEARQMGQRLFLTYCSQCHGSDAKGGQGFPDLTDNDWLYGGDPQTIEATITHGRHGEMPAWGPTLGEDGVKAAANYVLSLSGRPHDTALAAKGEQTFKTLCAACHGPNGKGNPALGAPNLTDNIWLYGGSEKTLIETIAKGRSGTMPAWGERLGPAKVHLLAAYVYSLSHGK